MIEETFSCPECGFENPKGSTSCKRCLLVFEKYEKKMSKVHGAVNASRQLEELWRGLLTDYDNLEKHEKFVMQSLAEKNLAFASQQYRKMHELNPSDEMAKKMIDKIIQVATMAYMPPHREPPPKSSTWIFKGFIGLLLLMLLFLVIQIFSHR